MGSFQANPKNKIELDILTDEEIAFIKKYPDDNSMVAINEHEKSMFVVYVTMRMEKGSVTKCVTGSQLIQIYNEIN